MRYLNTYKDGERLNGIYLVRQKTTALSKAGKPYYNIKLQDKTMSMDAKVWDVNNGGIEEFDELDYCQISGDISNYQGSLQVSIKRIYRAKAGEYEPADYLPVSIRDNDEMYAELLGYIDSVENTYLNRLLNIMFRENENLIERFRKSSAAKSIHHGFVGGLMEHTLSVTALCDYYCKSPSYGSVLNRDLLITAAICHDIGKVTELSSFPRNDYTEEGQLIGHIVLGCEYVGRFARGIEGFPPVLLNELRHCILAHQGEYEFGSPKKPAIIEALALHHADNTDAKLETFREILENNNTDDDWMGFNRILDSPLRKTSV